jgi:head-tail adaptor
MNAGQLRDRVTVQRLTRTRNADTGATVEVWTDTVTRWAKVTPEAASESPGPTGPDMVAPFSVTLRAPLDVTERDRLKWKTRTLNILKVTETVPGIRFDLTCVETR